MNRYNNKYSKPKLKRQETKTIEKPKIEFHPSNYPKLF